MKRSRSGHDEESDALLQAAARQGPEQKLKWLRRIQELLDSTDNSYEYQRRNADDVVPTLVQLLTDPSEAVVAEAAGALAAFVRHTPPPRASLLATSPRLNPVQGVVGGTEGVVPALVDLRLRTGSPEAAAAGAEALAALTCLNRGNTLFVLQELVHRLSGGEASALGVLDDMAAGLDARDTFAVVLDLALGPALGFLGSPTAPRGTRVAAAALLTTILSARRAAAGYLVAEGALAHAAALLVEGGDLEAQDAAAGLLWLLVKDNRRLLAPGQGALGAVTAAALVGPLLALVDKAEEAERAEDNNTSPPYSSKPGYPTPSSGAVENGDAAALLLRALARNDSTAQQRIRDHHAASSTGAHSRSSGCVVM